MTPTTLRLDRLLAAIRAEPNSTIEELAETCGMSPVAAYHQLYRARKRGVPILVKRVNDRGVSVAIYRFVEEGPPRTLMVRILACLLDYECWTTRQLAVVLGVDFHAVDQCLRITLLPKGLAMRRRAPPREHGPKFYYWHGDAFRPAKERAA